MKKVLLFFSALFLLSSCSNTDDPTTNGTNGETSEKNLPSTEVTMTANSESFWANAETKFNTNADAWFFIRIDNSIPGAKNLPSELYFPQTVQSGSFFSAKGGNKGVVDADSNLWEYYNERTTKYVYDPKGENTLKVLKTIPTLSDMLSVDKDQNNVARSTKYDETIKKYVGNDDYKIIWYVAKYEDGIFHVDGVLTEKSTVSIDSIPDIKPDITPTPTPTPDPDPVTPSDSTTVTPDTPDTPSVTPSTGNIEVYIDQQEHKDWEEIKTSIHLREFVNDLTVVIPIGKDFVAEADDFCLREYKFYTSKDNIDNAHPIKVTVSHRTDNIEITVHCDSEEYIKYLNETYGDGATIEVHSYTNTLITREKAWELIKQSKVYRSDSKVTTPVTSSAYFKN